MTKFQMYRAEAYDKLVDEYNKNPDKFADQSAESMIKKAEFVAKMRLAKENKKKVSSSQLNAF